jgi:hypothetical protein
VLGIKVVRAEKLILSLIRRLDFSLKYWFPSADTEKRQGIILTIDGGSQKSSFVTPQQARNAGRMRLFNLNPACYWCRLKRRKFHLVCGLLTWRIHKDILMA